MRRVPTPHHTAAQGHYPIVLIRWLQLTEVGLYLVYLRSWYGDLSKDEVQICYGIEATFNNYFRPGIIILCRD